MLNDHPFSNKIFLALGDFQQVAPVLHHEITAAAVFNNSIYSSFL
jgi:hypothetical protein